MRLPSSNKPQNLLYRYKWSPITQIPTLSTWLIKNIHFKINKYIKSRYIPFDFINRPTLILKRIVTNLPLVIGEKAVTCQLTTCVKGLPGVGQGWSTRDWSWGFEQPVLVIGSREKLHFKVSRLSEQCHSFVEAPRETMDFTHKRVYQILSAILDPLTRESDENEEDET